MSGTPSPKLNIPLTPQDFGGVLAHAEPSVFFSLMSSAIETVSSGIRLFWGTSDEYRMVNRNWARTSRFLFRAARSIALLIALLLFIFYPPFSSIFFGAIVMLTAGYNIGQACWSLYKLLTFKEDDPLHKADLKRQFKSNALGAIFALAAAGAIVALMMIPFGPAVLLALAITSSVLAFVLTGYTALQLYLKHRKKTTILDKAIVEEIDATQDETIIDDATRRSESHAHTSWHDYQYAVNYPHVVHTLTSQETAHDFLEGELFNYKLKLEQQTKRDRWLDHVQAKKRQAKLDLIRYYEDFLSTFKKDNPDNSLNFHEAFKEFLMGNENDPTKWKHYLKIKNLGTQSFCRHKGRMEDLIRGIGQHYEQTRLGQYGHSDFGLSDIQSDGFGIK